MNFSPRYCGDINLQHTCMKMHVWIPATLGDLWCDTLKNAFLWHLPPVCLSGSLRLQAFSFISLIEFFDLSWITLNRFKWALHSSNGKKYYKSCTAGLPSWSAFWCPKAKLSKMEDSHLTNIPFTCTEFDVANWLQQEQPKLK